MVIYQSLQPFLTVQQPLIFSSSSQYWQTSRRLEWELLINLKPPIHKVVLTEILGWLTVRFADMIPNWGASIAGGKVLAHPLLQWYLVSNIGYLLFFTEANKTQGCQQVSKTVVTRTTSWLSTKKLLQNPNNPQFVNIDNILTMLCFVSGLRPNHWAPVKDLKERTYPVCASICNQFRLVYYFYLVQQIL